MIKQPKISIIMPVFNGANTLDRAIKSLQGQTTEDWELIAVDDGSTDKSPLILDSYSKNDSRIKVIHKKNEGVSKARQEGLNVSKGDYIIHFDCDDWAEQNYLESLYNTAIESDADLVWCGVYEEYPTSSSRWSMVGPESPNEQIKCLLKGQIWGTVWNRLIKSSVCKSQTVSFPIGCVCWEDLAFLISVLLKCKKTAYCNKYLYHYDLCNSESITHTKNFKNLLENGYISSISHIEMSIAESGLLDTFQYELRERKLSIVEYYIVCQSVQNFEKAINIYPDVIEHIDEYPQIPLHIKQCVWLISHRCKFAVPFLLKYYSIFRLSKRIFELNKKL